MTKVLLPECVHLANDSYYNNGDYCQQNIGTASEFIDLSVKLKARTAQETLMVWILFEVKMNRAACIKFGLHSRFETV
jgi:hypothetical protein